MKKLECYTTLEDALRHAKALCELGCSTVIFPCTNGQFEVFYNSNV